jgi:hypothetical protein
MHKNNPKIDFQENCQYVVVNGSKKGYPDNDPCT